jgi:GDP-L-fucose synthase
MNPSSKIYVAGHRGLVGSALLRALHARGYTNIVTRASKELDLRRQADVDRFFAEARPEFVFLAAAKVGGIMANNTFKAEFIYDNLMIAANVINAAYRSGCRKLLNLGSSCIYPKFAPQPMTEDCLLTGPLEATNEPYAIAKIAAIKLCRYFNEQYGTDFLSVMPTNLYGPQDNFDLQTSHVLPALVRKFHDAKVNRLPHVLIWGTGVPYREFLYVDDLAEACLFLMEGYGKGDIGEFINVGSGSEITIRELAAMIRDIVHAEAEIRYDATKPDGTPRKLLDSGKLRKLGWTPKVSLQEGIARTYEWFLAQSGKASIPGRG